MQIIKRTYDRAVLFVTDAKTTKLLLIAIACAAVFCLLFVATASYHYGYVSRLSKETTVAVSGDNAGEVSVKMSNDEREAESVFTTYKAPDKNLAQNEFAPATKFPQTTAEYVARFAKLAKAEMNKFGVPASISLAQGIIESRAGASKLAVYNNNHFGIKCFKRSCPKGHCTNHTDDTHKDFFRKFSNAWESWREHSRMISTGRYAKLKKYGRDYKKWAHGLKSLGYATDRTYAEKLINTIEKYKLYRFDH